MTARLYVEATFPTVVCAALIARMVRCSLAPTAGPMKGTPSSSAAAPDISLIAPLSGPNIPSRLVRPASPAAISDDNADFIASM
ncbi:hypothetical protein D3C76_1404240 [compost metagenome]